MKRSFIVLQKRGTPDEIRGYIPPTIQTFLGVIQTIPFLKELQAFKSL